MKPYPILLALGLHVACIGSCQVGSAAEQGPPETGVQRNPFRLEALVDFVDDALDSPVPVNAKHVDAMMQRLKELGVRRVN
jgi:hypothetical protein